MRSSPLVLPAQSFQTVEKAVLAGLLLFSAMLFFIIYTLDVSVSNNLTSEQGLFEVMSKFLWVVLAVLCVVKLGFRKWGILTALLSLIFAAREADLHKAFTADSIFKTNYYKMDIPFAEKFWGGLVGIACIIVLVWVLFSCCVYLYRTKAWRQAWGRLTILAIAMVFFTKVCDRLESVLYDDFQVQISQLQAVICNMFEEGFEMLLPILFAIALLCWCRRVRGS
tara:strand:+ start:192009 stop:192680 length:672 start_codon:yes stop_codon:yes gene_type:complete